MSYFYGPVPSRRLGKSLGVDLFAVKTCSFDCLYCQLGKNPEKTIKRISRLNLNQLGKELKLVVKNKPQIDYVTISGSGEPTLYKGLDKIIAVIKRITKNKYPLCVITNSSLLYRRSVRQELKGADLIIPSLDAADAKTFRKINKPCKEVNFKKIITGLVELRKEFKGKIWLEIMLLKGLNDSLTEARKFKEIIKKIKPDKIQLNLPARPGTEKVFAPSAKRLKEIKNILSKETELVKDFYVKVRPVSAIRTAKQSKLFKKHL
ncbi:MAG: radical SAM protein [Candidatus Omnitrophota bacterium]